MRIIIPLIALLSSSCITLQGERLERVSTHLKNRKFPEARAELAKVRSTYVTLELKPTNQKTPANSHKTVPKTEVEDLISKVEYFYSDVKCKATVPEKFDDFMKGNNCLLSPDTPNLAKAECQMLQTNYYMTRQNHLYCLRREYENRIDTAKTVDERFPIGLNLTDEAVKAYKAKAETAEKDLIALKAKQKERGNNYETSPESIVNVICTVINPTTSRMRDLIQGEREVGAVSGYENKQTIYIAGKELVLHEKAKKEAVERYKKATGKTWSDSQCQQLAH